MVIAVDFDGTIVEHRYPAIGRELPFATETLRMLIRDRHKLILWSVREGALLEEAVEWCRERGVEFYAVLAQTESRPLHRRPQHRGTARLGHYLPDGERAQHVGGGVGAAQQQL